MMSNDVAIQVQGVGKKYCRSLKQTLVYGVRDVARDVFGITPASSELRRDEFWALNDVSFEVKRGECLGVIGANGAGKSTLLKLLNGVILPDKGKIRVRGKVGGLLELGAGFHPMLTGRENIHLSGAILGLRKEQINDKFDAIIDFAGLKDFIDSPVKYYSSGMYVRLGFAVAVHTNPDILLIDEALAVGDVLFQTKCFAKVREFKENGTIIILVTHSLGLVTTHCSRALLVNHGRLLFDQSPKTVVGQYNRLVATHGRLPSTTSLGVPERTVRNLPSKEIEWNDCFRMNPNEDRYGSRRAEILEAGIFDLDDSPAQVLERNNAYLIKVKVRHNESMPAAIVAYAISDANGQVLCGTNTLYQRVDMGQMQTNATVVVVFRHIARLNPGEYLLSLGCGAWVDGDYLVYDRRIDYFTFQIVGDSPRVGLFDPECTVEWKPAR
jgi:teichoic acid transport system ATP-binding protein